MKIESIENVKKVTKEHYSPILSFEVDENGTVTDNQTVTYQELRDMLKTINEPEVEAESTEKVEDGYFQN